MLQILRAFVTAYSDICVCKDVTPLFQHGTEHDTRIISCEDLSDARNAKPKTRKKEAP